MMYEKYEKRIMRIAKIKKILRIPTYCLIALLTVSLISFLTARGMITTDLESVSDISYGQTLSLQAEVLFGEAEFEFRLVGTSEWSTEEPILPGEYEVRVVSSRTFGSSTGQIVTFSIAALNANVSLRSTSYVFGDDFTFKSNELISGDYINYGNIDYDLEDYYTLNSQTVTPNVESLVVYNKNGVDVSTAYIFEANSSNMSFTKRPIEFKVLDATKEYDGESLTNSEYEVNNLIDGHKYEIDKDEIKNKSITHVNESGYHNTITSSKIFIEDKDISHMYNQTYTKGKLTITPRDITITTDSNNKEYDGTALVDTDYTQVGLISGDVISINSNASITYAGSISNQLNVSINSNGYSNDYKIIYINGTLTINKKNVTVKTNDDTKEYDGSSLSNVSLSATGLLSSDTIYNVSTPSITLVGLQENNVVVKILNGSNVVTNSYNITYDYGILEVTKTNITITSNDANKEYDDTPLINESYTQLGLVTGDSISVISNTSITNVSESGKDNILNVKIMKGTTDVSYCYNILYKAYGTLTIDKRVLTLTIFTISRAYDGTAFTNSGFSYNDNKMEVSGHNLKLTTKGSIIDVGSVVNEYLSHTITSGTTDVSDNYDINVNSGSLSITARQVDIITDSDSKVYDGTELIVESWDYNNSYYKLVSNHTLNLDYSGSQTDHGTSNNIANLVSVMNGTDNVTGNYIINISTGTLSVDKRTVNVITGNGSKVYDGTEIVVESWDYNTSTYKLVSNHELTLNYTGTRIDYGTSNNTATLDSVMNGTDNVSNNYTINIATGTLSVEKRTVDIITDSDTKVYDGTALVAHSCDYNNSYYELLSGHTLTLNYTGTQTTYGTSNNTATLVSVMNGNINVSNNYIINIATGTLEVTKKQITVTTNSNTTDLIIYNGEIQCYDSFDIDYDTLYSNKFTSSVGSITGGINVGKYANEYKIVIELNGNDVTDNFDISYEYGTLTITARTIIIKTADNSKVYDGYELVAYSWDYDNSTYKLLSGHTLNLNYTGTQTIFGTSDNSISGWSISNGTNVSNNYNVEYSCGKLEVTQRSITITAKSLKEEYDGNEHSLNDFDLSYKNDTDTVYIEANGSITNVGNVYNVLDESSLTITHNSLGDVIGSYNITCVDGTLEIYQRNITITTYGATKEYDGLELTNQTIDANSVDGLVFGHVISYDFTGSQTDAGDSFNTIENIVILSPTSDVTYNYKVVDIIEGTLEVTQRTITITSNDASKVFDNTALINKTCTTNNKLVNANGIVHTINNLDFIIGSQIYYSKDKVYNTIDENLILIVDHNSKNVTSNYKITKEEGTLTILKREIEITTYGATKEYDGNYLFNDNFTTILLSNADGYDVLGNNINIKVSDYTKVLLVSDGEVENKLTFIIYDNNDIYTDLSYNYSISYDNGYLSLSQCDIALTTASASKEYDGDLLSAGFMDGYSLQGSDIIDITYYTEVKYYTTGKKNYLEYKIYNGELDVTQNYKVVYNEGTLSISKRNITITTHDVEFTYNGYEQTSHDNAYSLNKAFIDAVIITFVNTVKNVGDVKENSVTVSFISSNQAIIDSYEITTDYGILSVCQRDITVYTNNEKIFVKLFDEEQTLVNAGFTYDGLGENHNINLTVIGKQVGIGSSSNIYEEGSISIFDGLENVINNYNIKYELGLLTIERDLEDIYTIVSGIASKTFDGTELTYYYIEVYAGAIKTLVYSFESLDKTHEIEINGGTLIIEFSDDARVIIPERVDNDFTYKILSGDDDITDSYCNDEYELIYCEFGHLTISKINIKLQSGTKEFQYTGEEQVYHIYEIISGYILEGHVITATYYNSILIPSIVNNTFSIVITEDDFNYTNFYQIECVPGKLIMEAGSITVNISSNNPFEYNGDYQSYLVYIISEGSEVLSDFTHSVDITKEYSSLKNVGSIVNSFEIMILANDVDITKYFDINYIPGTLSVKEKNITVSVSNEYIYSEYNGDLQTINEQYILITHNGNIFNYSIDNNIIIIASGDATTIGIVNNLKYTIYLGDTDTTANYNITYEKQTITFEVTKKEITIQIDEYIAEFTGVNQFANNYTVIKGEFAASDEDVFTFNSTYQKNINFIKGEFIDDENYLIIFSDLFIGSVSMETYYEISLDYSKISKIMITQIEIIIQIAIDEKNYDGTALSNNTFKVFGNVLSGDSFNLEVSGEITQIGSVVNEYVLNSLEIVSNTPEAYDVTINNGTLTINKISLTFNLYSMSKEYPEDDINLTYENYQYYKVVGLLPAGYTTKIDVKETYGLLEISNVYVYDEQGNIANNNFEITAKSVVIAYQAINITFTSASVTKSYDGTSLSSNEVTITDGYLIAGHTVEFEIVSSRTTVGTTTNQIKSYTIYDSKGNPLSESDLLKYYNVTTINGTLTIT